MPASHYFVLSLLGGEAVRFKSGQKAKGKKKENFLKGREKNLGHIWLLKLLCWFIWL